MTSAAKDAPFGVIEIHLSGDDTDATAGLYRGGAGHPHEPEGSIHADPRSGLPCETQAPDGLPAPPPHHRSHRGGETRGPVLGVRPVRARARRRRRGEAGLRRSGEGVAAPVEPRAPRCLERRGSGKSAWIEAIESSETPRN